MVFCLSVMRRCKAGLGPWKAWISNVIFAADTSALVKAMSKPHEWPAFEMKIDKCVEELHIKTGQSCKRIQRLMLEPPRLREVWYEITESNLMLRKGTQDGWKRSLYESNVMCERNMVPTRRRDPNDVMLCFVFLFCFLGFIFGYFLLS
ncbi:unnamed protein product [Arabis nemorensis]|uniref:Uncharacterized protein n=1 Tax=Arabis nemorensis TaxID=586526 RepID=A0A565BCC7_9BRAS|nr:unnamed protein product [Arabis nemorensis]